MRAASTLPDLGVDRYIIDVRILQNTAQTPGNEASLVIETALEPVGPWTGLVTYGSAGYTHSTTYFTSREGGTNKFGRYLRWVIDRSTAENWEIAFRINATLK